MKHTLLKMDYLKDREPKYSLFRKLIAKEYGGDLTGKRVLDLGAGHCLYSNICAELGAEVVAVDARDVRVPKNLHPNVKFVKRDIIRQPIDGEGFDLVLCFGLLYHLSAAQQEEVLTNLVQAGAVWVDTHCCADNAPNKVTESGYQGTHYQEAKNMKQMMANPKASSSTLVSFWPTKASLLAMFETANFLVFQEVVPEHYPNRTFWLLK